MKKSVTNTFVATHALGIIITNSDYSKTEFKYLEEAIEDHETILEHFEDIGVKEVIQVKDSYAAFRRCWLALEERVEKAHNSKGAVKLMVYIYNAGHGVMFGGSPLT